MDLERVKRHALDLKSFHGGSIFIFPVDVSDPLSEYALVSFFDGRCVVWPSPMTIEETMDEVRCMMELRAAEGYQVHYDKDVRFVTYQAQENGTNLTIHRLKKLNQKLSGPILNDSDINLTDNDEYEFTGKGLIKMSYLTMMQNPYPRAVQIMKGYYELLDANGYGKTADAISQEVGMMSQAVACLWIDQMYPKYIQNDNEIIDLYLHVVGD